MLSTLYTQSSCVCEQYDLCFMPSAHIQSAGPVQASEVPPAQPGGAPGSAAVPSDQVGVPPGVGDVILLAETTERAPTACPDLLAAPAAHPLCVPLAVHPQQSPPRGVTSCLAGLTLELRGLF